jgi:DNA-binding NtrC family response regulator
VADRHTILLVDDDSEVREMLAAVLAKSFDVLVAEHGAEAIKVITDWHVDLLLTDIIMPGMDGFDLADQAISMRPSLRVIYMTGYSDQATNSTRAKHGKLIPKPFRTTQMVSEIKSSLAA